MSTNKDMQHARDRSAVTPELRAAQAGEADLSRRDIAVDTLELGNAGVTEANEAANRTRGRDDERP